MSAIDLTPVTLAGRHVRLEPLTLDHVAVLAPVALDPALWELTTQQLRTEADLRAYVADALAAHAAGTALPFATIDVATGRAIGSTRFGNAAPADRRVEIGWTWLARDAQRTAANTEAKLLMLTHAFERWQVNRVELKTDARNARSRAAILRLGATEEGTLRHHMVTYSGRLRDSVYYSVLREEWAGVKERLKGRLQK
jgi:N-acetyltransferase